MMSIIQPQGSKIVLPPGEDYLHCKMLPTPFYTAAYKNWHYNNYKLTDGWDVRYPPQVRGHAVSFWFRLNGPALAGSGYWYDRSVVNIHNMSDTSNPWIGVGIHAGGPLVRDNTISVGGNGQGNVFDLTRFPSSVQDWWIFGADGKSPRYGKWYFIMGSYSSANYNSYGRVAIADEDGNYAFSSNYSVSQTGVYGSDHNHTQQGVGVLGSFNGLSYSSYRHIDGDICHLHCYYWKNQGASQPFKTSLLADGHYLVSAEFDAPLSDWQDELNTDWEVRGYWPLTGTLNLHEDFGVSGHDLTLGDDGEFKTGGGPVLS